jgi:hypothetical protein
MLWETIYTIFFFSLASIPLDSPERRGRFFLAYQEWMGPAENQNGPSSFG